MTVTARRAWSFLAVLSGVFVVRCSGSGASVPDVPKDPSNGSPTASTGMCSGAQCDCHEKPTCAIDCGSQQGCNADCHQDQTSCDVSCRNDCKADCHQSGACHVNCGDRCNLDCHQTTGACTAKVGVDSTVDCHQTGVCQIQCVGACNVACQDSKSCKVVCGVLATCTVQCTGGAAPTLCADNKTKVCPGTTC